MTPLTKRDGRGINRVDDLLEAFFEFLVPLVRCVRKDSLNGYSSCGGLHETHDLQFYAAHTATASKIHGISELF